ncbi:SUMO1 sentrin specific peptidase 8 [Homalodisca vitripennis]|nr:SUMO1 sentrin specific peptidase 8 [Homalodisca vitripennis]
MHFAAGDNVFGKVKGYPPWPAKIKSIVHQDTNTYYNVEFYGTHERAKLKSSDLCFYSENKAELGKPRMRNLKFNSALQEIEQSINEYSKGISLNIENENRVNESHLINSQLETRVAEHACELHNIFGILINRYGPEDFTKILQVTTNILEEYNETVIANSLLKSQNNELESKCTDIEKALQKEKSVRLEELELSVCMEADVEVDVQKHKDTIRTLTQDLSTYIEDAKVKNNIIQEQIANAASLNNELNQLRKDNEFLNSRIIQLNKIAESVNSRFNNQVNDFKGLENTLKQQIVELKQQLSNLKGKSLDGQDGSVTAQGNDFTLCSTLLANGWIQDDLISLYFDLLLQSSIMKDAYFMKPCIGQAIKCAENVDVLLEHEIFNKSYVFIPISDSKGEMEVSGSHWSLMLYTKTENTFYYFDLMNNYNLGHARDVFTRLKSRMCSTGPSCFTEVSCPQQRNGSDCGVYVLLFVDRLIGMLLTRKDLVGFDFKECFGSSEINELDIIQKQAGRGYCKEIDLCGKSDIKTDLPKINTYETHANVERQENKPNEEQVKILEEELNNLKNENENLQSVVEILYSDKKQLQDKINKAESVGQHCLKCSLPLVNKTAEHSPNQNKGRVKTRDQTVHVNKATKKSKSNLIILADSHGRDLGRLIEQKTTLNVCSFVKPGAKFSQVTKEVKDLTAELEPSDYLLVLAGTNNIQTTGIDTLMNDITKLVNDFQHINLILSTIPMRHDLPQLDLKISIINSKIERLAENFPNLQLLPLHLLPRHVFTAHGLHFNMKGKARIADMVFKLKQMKGTSHNVPRQPKNQTHPFSIPSCKITVLETDINQLMDHFQNDQSVGFAHSISADFENTEKHMSAGIAVVFRKRFGRPKTSDLVNKHLAYQKVINGPSVYSLITKDKYRITKQEYDAAFLKLQEDFISKDLKTLVCSAVGCVRDLIQVSHFAKNIVEFQQVTGATVCIVSYEQPTAQRQLWRGLTHNEFVRTLRKQLAEHQAQKQQLDISPSSQSPLSGEVVVLSDIGLSVDTFASCLSLTVTPTLSQNISLTDSPTSSQNTFLTKTPTKLQNVSPTNTSSTNVTGNSVDLN